MINAFGRKEMFYLMMHSTHFMVKRCQIYGKGPLRLTRGNLLPLLHGHSFQLALTDILYALVIEHWLEPEIS